MIKKLCRCGFWITSSTISQLNYNMNLHINGKKHKKQMKAKEEKENGKHKY